MPSNDEDIETLEESLISFRISELIEGLSQTGQPIEETLSSEDSVVLSSCKEMWTRFMREEKGKKKIPEYEFGSTESDRRESDIGPIEKKPLQKRSKLAEKVLKLGNHVLHRSTRLKNPVKRYGYNEYMAHHYAYMT